eukprot:jgi/Hompol1/5768/HPOL_004721-RA
MAYLLHIFGDEFVQETVVDKNAWKVQNSETWYVLRLQPLGSEFKELVSISLCVKFPRSYPATPVEFTLRKEKGLSDQHIDDLKKVVAATAKKLAGEEMVYEIASAIQEFITEHNAARKPAPLSEPQKSFYDLMQDRLQQDNERKRQQVEQEEQMNQRMTADKLEEDQTRLAEQYRLELERKEALIKDHGRRKKMSLPPSTNQETPLLVVVQKELSFVATEVMSEAVSTAVDTLGTALARAANVSSSGIVKLYDYNLHRDARNAKLNIELLMDGYLGGSLAESMKRFGAMEPTQIKRHARTLLEIIDRLHSRDVMHLAVTSKNIYFSASGDLVITGHLYQHHISKIQDLCDGGSSATGAQRAVWQCPDFATGLVSTKVDVWMAGLVILEMSLGDRVSAAISLQNLLGKKSRVPTLLSALVSKMMAQDPDERPSALQALEHPFFVADFTNLSPISTPAPQAAPERSPVTATPLQQELSANSFFEANRMHSRYHADFDELEFLGRGGFGQVVKARNRLDGAFYAIKKVKMNPKDKDRSDRLLREVQTLSRLHNEFVVRYYQAWFEKAPKSELVGGPNTDDSYDDDDSDSESDESTNHQNQDTDEQDEDDESDESDSDEVENGFRADWLESTDVSISFLSSSVHQQGASDSEYSTNNGIPGHRKSEEYIVVLYIQMEYCEKETLRNYIDRGVDTEEAWRLFRQILEGLAHIHSQNIIHRDLKPSNAVFLDANKNVKIGDFGLATARRDAQIPAAEFFNSLDDTSLTSEIGTPVYIAPEILNKAGRYNSKVDMYSLGIIFFEMVYPLSTGMQRAVVLRDLRSRSIIFPKDFDHQRLESQGQIITQLLSHIPKERPSCMQLLQSPLVPSQVEEEYINEELLRIVRQNNPTYFSRLITSLFNQKVGKHKDLAYDFNSSTHAIDLHQAAIISHIKRHVTRVFTDHGAVPLLSPLIVPKTDDISDIYVSKRPAELLDSTGNIVQLRYDLTVPFARMISRMSLPPTLPIKRYAIERVFRGNVAGGQPRTLLECDFDIIYRKSQTMLAEAEVIKVLCEVLDFTNYGSQDPTRINSPLASTMSMPHIRISHSRILPIVFEYCGIPLDQRHAVQDLLEQLDRQIGFSQMRSRLSELGLSKACIERLAFGVKRRIVFEPLLVFNTNVFSAGVIFQLGRRMAKRFGAL